MHQVIFSLYSYTQSPEVSCTQSSEASYTLSTQAPSFPAMSLSTQPLRSSPYTLPPPGGAARLASTTRQLHAGPYSSPSFPSQLQHQYNFSPQTSQSGFSFQNPMLFPSSQGATGMFPPPPLPPPPPQPLPTSTPSMPLPDSPVSLYIIVTGF